jgi:hypothetical protein
MGMHESYADIVQRILQRPLQYYGILYDEVQMSADADNGANVIVNLNDFSHIMTDEIQLQQRIYDALHVSDAIMDKLL